MQSASKPIVLAAVAHPDDIEFYFSGTLLLLSKMGCSLHMWNLADGCCGSTRLDRKEIARVRAREAAESAALAGAVIHSPLFHDLEIFYDRSSLAQVAAVVRKIKPTVILTHSPDDYMEDHQNTCRLVVTAAFSRGIPNFLTNPDLPPYADPVRVYHGSPHSLQDGLEHPFEPTLLVDIGSVMETKGRMLACHASQETWLQDSQAMPQLVAEMERITQSMAELGGTMRHAEGWRRHSHFGFCPGDFDPLPALLENFVQHVRKK